MGSSWGSRALFIYKFLLTDSTSEIINAFKLSVSVLEFDEIEMTYAADEYDAFSFRILRHILNMTSVT